MPLTSSITNISRSTRQLLFPPPCRALAAHLRRGYFTIPSVRFSPSHTSPRRISWLKSPGDTVSCYDLLYTCDGYNVTIFCDSEKKAMQVECCEEGVLSWVRVTAPSDDIKPGQMLGILASSEEEDERIREIIMGEGSDVEALLALGDGLEDEGVITWEAYLLEG